MKIYFIIMLTGIFVCSFITNLYSETINDATVVVLDNQEENTGTLEVTITKLKNNEGKVIFILTNSEESYNVQKKNKKKKDMYKNDPFLIVDGETIVNNQAKIIIKNLPYGEYAIIYIHDENDNDKFDFNLFRMPVERYGFSNNIHKKYRPPDYKDAKFIINGESSNYILEAIDF